MWYLKVSSSLLIAVALICMIQNAISLTVDTKATDDQWSALASSTDQNDLKKISKQCKVSLNNFNEKLENTKTIANKKLPEPNKTTEDIANLVSDIKNQVKNASADLVNVRKLVQKTALRFRDTFKSLVSFTELDNESVNKELDIIKKTTVDSKKPLVNRVIRSFGNRYDLNKLANKVLEISSDREKLKNNYNEKKKIAKKEFNSLWNSLFNHSKTVNDNALKALDTFFEGMGSVKSVKKQVKTLGEDALNEIKVGDDIIKLKNAVELAKSLKLKFEDEWNLDSGELTYSEEQKKPNTKTTDDDQSDIQENEEDKSNENISTNDLEPGLPTTEQEPIENDKSNLIPPMQAGIEKLPIIDNRQTSDKAVSPTEEVDNNISGTIDSTIEENPPIPNSENIDKTVIVQPEVSNKDQNTMNDDDSKSDSPIKETSFNPDINNNKVLNTPLTDSIDNKSGKRINKITGREKTLILPWEKLIQLDNPHVSQQSMNCENLLNNVTPDFDTIKKAVKNSIQVTKNYKTLQNIENDTVKQFYDKMVDTNTKLCSYLVNAADDVCDKVTPINKRYETKFKNDPNIKRIKYLLGKQYDPNQYILKVLDNANHKNGIGGMKKTTYYKMLAVAHNLNHETKEMENAALYAMNKIHEGKLAATNLQKKFNKEKASKACYIKNILLEKENEDDKKNKDENKEKVKENINEDTSTDPLKPDVNLDSVDAIQPSTVNDDNEPIINNDEDTKTLSEPNESTNLNNNKEDAHITNFENSKNTKGSNAQGTQEPYSSSSIPENKDNDINTSIEKYGNNKGKRNITRRITHHRKHRNPNDPNDESEEYDSIEEIDDEEDESNESRNKLEKIQNEVGKENLNMTSRPKISEEIESLEQEGHNSLNKSDEKNERTDKRNTSGKTKDKRYRKRINPKDGKEITEEYDTSEEDDDINQNKSGETKYNEAPESESLDNPKNEYDKETPEHLETEKVDSNEENTSVKPKVKHYRKRIDPNDGKEITEEYDTSEEEDDINPNKSGVTKSNEGPESKLLDNANNKNDKDTPEHLETEKVDSNEENATQEENDEGNTSVKPKVKHYRKRIDPSDGKEITEEYDTSEEEDDINPNKTGEKKSDEAPESELLDNSDNKNDKETPEHLETEKVDSNEENTSDKPKVKHYRKRIDPKDGKEITEEYDTSEEDDDINQNKSGETKSNEDPESNLLDNEDNKNDKETPEHLETEKVDSNEENTSVKPKVKHYRKRIDPNDGKEITEEYDTLEEEDDTNPNKSGETKSNEAPESKLLDNANNKNDKETPEHLETEKVDSNEENATQEENDEGNTSVKPKVKHYRKRIDPKDGKEITEEYDTSEEEDDINPNKSGETKSNEAPESKLLDNANNKNDKETPEHLETEKVDSNEENTSVKPKVKHYRKRIDPKDGKEITEEYDTSVEEDDINPNKSGETKSDEAPESELLDNSDNKNDKETPEHLETEKVDSNEENTSDKPKVKHYRKRIDPNDGKEITEEYDTSEEEDDINPNKSGVTKSSEAPESKLLDNTNNKNDKDTPEHLETEKVDSNEENATQKENDEDNTSVKPKVKHYRKRIDPNDGKEITEEYDTSEEEDDINPNKSGETKSDEAPESELLDNSENKNDKETPEHLETEKIDSNEERNEGNMSVKPKVKHYRKRIDPKDGKEITEEYDTSEEDDDINQNKSGETKSNEDPESNLLDNEDNKNDKETPEHLETEKDDSNEENTSVKPKVKHYRKRIDPKDGKEITEEYDTSEEEDDINPNKSGETKSDKAPESELMDNSDNKNDKETPEHLETEKVDSNEENATQEENDEGNTSVKPKVKHYRKRIDPKDGKEITEEYDTSEEEDDINPNKSGETKSDEAPESELLDNSDNKNDKETPEHLETEKVDSNEENTSDKPKVKHYRKRIDPNDGKEITEEYDTSEEEDDINPNKSGVTKSSEDPESKLLDNTNKKNDKDTPEHLETEKVDSNEENATQKENDEYNTSVKPKVKHYRKRIDPNDGKEITEEYDTSEEEDDINPNKSGETKSDEAPESELLDNSDNKNDKETPEHLETEKVDSNEERNEGNMSVKPKVKHYRKRIDPKDGKEITEEYDTSEEDYDINQNKSGETKSKEVPESNLLDNEDNKNDKETPEHLETEKDDSNEENSAPEESSEENTSAKPKDKHYRKRLDSKDDKEITEEKEISQEENANKSDEKIENKSDEDEHDKNEFEQGENEDQDSVNDNSENKNEFSSEEESNNKRINHNGKQNSPKTKYDVDHDLEHNDDNSQEVKAPLSEDNEPDVDPENITRETVELDENENLNSVEGAELNGVDNDNIIPAADSMGEDSSSVESSYEEPEQSYLNDSKNTHKNNNKKYNSDNQPNKTSKVHRKRKDPTNGQEISDEYGTDEELEDESPETTKNNPPGTPDEEAAQYNNVTNESEEPEHNEIPENEETPDHNQSNENEVMDENEPERRSIEEINNSNDIDQQNDGGDQPSKKMRSRRKRKVPKDGREVPEEYETVEDEGDDGVPENGEITENDEMLDRNQPNDHEVIDENEPERRSIDEINKSNDIDQQNDGGVQPSKKTRRRRKRKDPKDGREVPEEYDPVDEQEDESPVSSKNNNTPTGTPDEEAAQHNNITHESEEPEHDEVPENEEIPENNETPDHKQSNEHEVINENEPERRSIEEINNSNDIDQQNDPGDQPSKKMRRRRKRKNPKDGREVPEEYDTVEDEGDDGVPENGEITENDEMLDRNQPNDHEVIDENEPERRSIEEINNSNDIDQQNDGGVQPSKKTRRRRKRKDPKDGREVPEEYDPVDEQEDESPVSSKNNNTPTGTPDEEAAQHNNITHESEEPEHDEIPENEEIPENNEIPDHNQSNEHEVINENEPERRSIEEINNSNDIDQQNYGGDQPSKKMRRRRKRKDPMDGREVPEEYDPVDEQGDESPVLSKNNNTLTGTPDEEAAQHNNVTHESEEPEHDEITENEEIPENHETPDHNQSNEHEMVDENEPERRSIEEINNSNDIDQQNYGGDQPSKKKRRRRKRKVPKDGREVPEEYDTVEDEGDDGVPENGEITENDEMLDRNQPNDHEVIDENEPERRSIEEINKSNDNDQQNDGGDQPSKKTRRRRKRKVPKDGREVPEEYETVEDEGDDGVPENGEITENDEMLDRNQPNDHEVIDENEPERRSIDEINKSNDIDQQNDGDVQPSKKTRRRRKRKDPKDGREVPEEYDPVDEHEDESPVSSKNNNTPTGTPDEEAAQHNNITHESEEPEHDEIPENEEIPENYETPDHKQSNEHEVINENEPEGRSIEEINNSNDIDQQNYGGVQPSKKMRRRRKRINPMDGREVPEEYDPVDEQGYESPVLSKNNNTLTGTPDEEAAQHNNVTHESEEPEHDEITENEEIPENHETPDHNQSNEHEMVDENEPERRSIEEINNSNDIDQQNYGGDQPSKKKRRRRKRKVPKDGREVPEEYDPVDEQEDESPVSSKNNNTPTGTPDEEAAQHNNITHESEEPEHDEIPENEEIPENYETPDHKQSNEHEVINENEPERRSIEEINNSNDIDQQNYGGVQPSKKMRRRRKRIDPMDGREVPEEYDPVDEQGDESPVLSKNNNTLTGTPDEEAAQHNNVTHESEEPEHDEITENEEIPENHETPDHNQSNEHEMVDENEPERRSIEEINNSNDIDQQNYGGDQPSKKKRRRRKRKVPKDGREVPEEYDPVDEQEDESPVSSKNNNTPTGTPDEEAAQHNNITHESEEPENDEIPENEEIPENNEIPDHNQSNEHEVINENEPERRSIEEINNSNDIDQQNDPGDQPSKKMRRRRKRKDPMDGREVPEEYDPVDEQGDESPVLSKNNNTLTGTPDEEAARHNNVTHESEEPEHDEIAENEEIPENHETPDHNQSNEHEMVDENEPERRSNGEINKSSDSEEQNNGSKKPIKKLRRHRKRKDPNYDQEILEEYDTVEDEGDDGVPENGEITENEEMLDRNQPNDHEVIDENEPERRSIEEINNSNDIDQQNYGGDQPSKKKRRRRKRKDPKVGQEVPEEYDTVDEQEDESPVASKNNRTPDDEAAQHYNIAHESEEPEYDKIPEYNEILENEEIPENNEMLDHNQSNENEPERRSIEEINKSNDIDQQNDGGDQPNKKIRRHRKRKDPLHSHEISEEYETIEYEDNEINKLETPNMVSYDQFDNNPISSPNNENNANDENYIVNPPKYKPKRFKNRKNPEYDHEMSEEYDSLEEYDDEPELKKPTFRPEIYDEYRDLNNNVIPNINIPYDDDNIHEQIPETGNAEMTGIDNATEYPENSDVAPEALSPNDVYETINFEKPRPRKVRRHKKLRQPKTVNEKDNQPEKVNDDNNVPEELPEIGNGKMTDIDNEIEQPELSEYPENSGVAPEALSPNDVDETINLAKPRPRKVRRHKKSRKPKTVNEKDNEPEVEDNDNKVQEELPETGKGETTDIDDEIEQPELSEYPENSDVPPEALSPNNVDETINFAKPRPRKVRHHKKSRQPKTVNEKDNEPEVVNDINDANHPVEDEYVNYKDSPYNGNDVQEDPKNNSDKSSHIGKKQRKKPRRSKENKITEDPKRIPTQNNEHINEEDSGENEKTTNLNDTEGTMNSKQPRRIKHVRRKKIPTTVDEFTPNGLDTENRRIQNDDKLVKSPETQPNDTEKNPPKKRRLRRIRTYMVNKATNERIPINDQTYSTTDGLPDTPKNKLDATEIEDSDDPDSNEDNDDYSSFVFKEYNSDQCKRNAYNRFKKVKSQDAKQIAYRSILDTSEMRSNMLATVKDAIGNVKKSKTLNDVDQSLRTVSYSLKTGLKQTVSDLVTKVIPLAKNFLKTAENLKELYKNGPQSTHKMLSNILENESIVPDSAKDILKLISPQFDVDELINNIFEKPFNTKSLKEKKTKAQRKLISLSKHMDTAISNIDCFVLSAMSAVGIGADTLKLLKSGRVIMSDKHPRSKALRDAMGIIKSGKKIRNNDVGFTPTLTPADGITESDEDDDDEDPDQVAQKNEEFLRTVPDLDDNISVPKKVPNKRQSLGVIVVHPDKQIEYKEVTDTSQLKKFVGDQTKKYKLQSKNKHPKFLKLNSKKLIDSMVADVKKKAERNGMSKKEMVEEIIKNLKST